MNTNIASELLRVARDVLALEIKSLMALPSGTMILTIAGKYPKYFITSDGDRKTATSFDIYEIRTQNDVEKQLTPFYMPVFDHYDNNRNEQAEAAWKKFREVSPPSFFHFDNMTVHSVVSQYGGGSGRDRLVFLKYFSDLSRADYTEIEQILKGQDKDKFNVIVRKHQHVDLSGLYDFLVGKLKMNRTAFKDVFDRLPDESTLKAQKAVRMGKWEVWWGTDTDLDEVIITGILGNVEGILGKQGMDKLAYGLVSIVPMRRGQGSHKIADYAREYDSVRLSNEVTKTPHVVYSFVHELGHRYWYKFMDIKKISAVAEMYGQIKSKDAIPILEGEVIQSLADNKEFVVKSEAFGKVMLQGVEDKVAYSSPKEKFNAKNFHYKNMPEVTLVFPTPYSRKNEIEFFAECFTFWCHGWLKGELVTWFDDIMK